jgi:hypothetical protein
MPDGKPEGVRCIHLLDDYKCALYGHPSRPKVCIVFKPEPEFCGKNREEALKRLSSLSDPPGGYFPDKYTTFPPTIV